MENIESLLFDCDGTLIDTYKIILTSMRYTVNEILGQNRSDKELMNKVGTPLTDQMLYFLNGDQTRVDEIVATYRNHNDGIHDEGVKIFPNVKETLEKLKDAGYKMGIVTSKRHFMADRGLQLCGIRDYFDVLIGSDDFPIHKPNPEPILEGCRLLDTDPSHCAYIGDSPYDIQAGNSAGCTSIAALWGMFSPESLEAENPSYKIEDFSELDRLLRSL